MSDRAQVGRIAYLTGVYPAVSHTFILREIAALRAEGRDVITCATRRPEARQVIGAAETAEAAATFYVLDAAKSPITLFRALGHALRRPGRAFAALRLAWRTRPPGAKAALWQMFYLVEAAILARHLAHVGATHLHNHFGDASGTVAMLASALSGIPFSLTLHGPTLFFEPRRWRLDEKTARASFVACISHFCRSQAMIFADPRDWDKLAIVHCGIHPDRYGRDRAARGTHLIFVGRLAAVKGVPVLLDAVAAVRKEHPDVALTLVGDGPERGWIETRAAELGIADAVRITGYLSQDRVASELAQAGLFVLPSFAEGVPVVLMEAMATGLPVIATRIAGIPELVEDGVSGRLVPPGDADALAAAIGELLSDPGRADAMGEAGRSRVVSDFDQVSEAAKLGRLFDAAHGKKGPET